jgi:hypothetical protein
MTIPWCQLVSLGKCLPFSRRQSEDAASSPAYCGVDTLALECIAVFALIVLAACSGGPQFSKPSASAGEWHQFQGTWTAAGSRDTIRLDKDRRASISTFNGSLVLAGPSRPGVGFRSEAIVFNDSATGLLGRAVWTDERGDKVFSELRGEGTATNNIITGTFIGGTGRYAGATGSYEFSWRFLIQNEEGVVQGQSVGLNGQVRAGPQQLTSREGGPQP